MALNNVIGRRSLIFDFWASFWQYGVVIYKKILPGLKKILISLNRERVKILKNHHFFEYRNLSFLAWLL